MITVLMEDCNGFSQDLYKSLIDSLQLHMVECTCGKKGCLIFFGHYHRLVKYLSNTVCLCIQRVFCKECGKTNSDVGLVLKNDRKWPKKAITILHS